MKTCLSKALLALLPFAAACRSGISYDDPDKVETVSLEFGSTDLKALASDMTNSLLASPGLRYVQHPSKAEGDPRTVFAIGGVNNRTSEHIDTAGITDSIRTAIIKSGEYRFVANTQGQEQLGDQVRFQQESGRVDPSKAKAFGSQLGADVIIYGNLRSIEKERGRNLEDAGKKTEDVWYQFVLEAVNIETGEIIWMNEKDIRKTEKRGIFG